MTTDERLERLAERHEALTQTVELRAADIREIAGARQEAERRFAELAKTMGYLARLVASYESGSTT